MYIILTPLKTYKDMAPTTVKTCYQVYVFGVNWPAVKYGFNNHEFNNIILTTLTFNQYVVFAH